jgi:hypothetical protein
MKELVILHMVHCLLFLSPQWLSWQENFTM